MSSSRGRRRSSGKRMKLTGKAKRQRLIRRSIVAGIVAVIAGIAIYLWASGKVPVGEAADDWYEVRSGRGEQFVQLPQDDEPHDNFMEWWYYNGHLETNSGVRYNFHFAFFVVQAAVTHSVAHASLVDQQSGRHYTDQKLTPGKPSRKITNGFDFDLSGWQMVGGDGEDRLRVSTSDFRLNLLIKEDSPPVIQGGSGLLDFGLVGSSFYYSRPRMHIQGELEVAGAIENVTGLAWFDHQWGDFDVIDLGWDWFALQLDDGSDIMVYLLFDGSGRPVLRTATLTQNGKTEVLAEAEFQVEAVARWVSDKTGIDYPMGWRVRVPARNMELAVKPVITASEFDGRSTTGKVYWEGAVEIGGTHGGKGFVEMSGYDKVQKETLKRPVKGG
ncbi:MAG: hypothetical protein GY703_00565 [Gammaproteobacteria bacterium]|nr:hypothetical protein [Gammaproteobacteria bacterium]